MVDFMVNVGKCTPYMDPMDLEVVATVSYRYHPCCVCFIVSCCLLRVKGFLLFSAIIKLSTFGGSKNANVW